ncbi:MAG TPA: phospholipase D-like domain-containing protein, partial [Phycisphaerales bacterium]|nr:phospholipase D-like domain-containing protein [Phycisphaerales bacterium]
MSSGSASRVRKRWSARSEKLTREFRRQIARLRSATNEAKRRRLLRHWEKLSHLMLALGACSTGNTIALYHNGDDCFEAQWDAIAKAKRRVWLEMYTLAPDGVGLRMLEELTKAAKRGCKVILMVDAIGSSTLHWRYVAELKNAGAEVLVFNRIFPWFRWARLFQRDHRKILIVDNAIAFTGGMNVSELYAGKKYGT